MLKTRTQRTTRQAPKPKSDPVVLVLGTPSQERQNRAALEMLDSRMKKITQMTDIERKAAARDYEEYEELLRANALSPRNR